MNNTINGIIKVIGYEEARTNFLKSEMEKAQNRIKFWQTKIKKAKNAIAEMEAHDNASNAGWEYNFYKDALEALEAGEDINVLTAQPKWISVEERLPDKSGEVLICVYGHVTIAWYSVNRFETGGGMVFFVDDHFADDNEVTHWMPLPQPPKEESYGTKGTAEVKPHVRPARGE